MKCKKYYKDEEKYKEARNKQKRAWRLRTGSASTNKCEKAGPYTCWEDELVLAHDIPDRELAKKLGRSAQSIQTRRSRLTKGRKDKE